MIDLAAAKSNCKEFLIIRDHETMLFILFIYWGLYAALIVERELG